ncbi:MAG: hypothetical protein HY723_06620 [Chloroflexi bacterium]|nr:hypothetical protein [Chloroflexota bacterium]
MSKLTKSQEAILADCLRAMEAGTGIDACLARFPQHADALRPYLELRARLLAAELPAPHPAAYQAGRQALLNRLVEQKAAPLPTAAGPWRALGLGWLRLGSPAGRAVAAGLAVVLLAGGALGASAATGRGPANDILSALRIVDRSSDDGVVPDQDAGAPADDAVPTRPAVVPQNGDEPGDPAAEQGAGCISQEALDLLPFLGELLPGAAFCDEEPAGPDGQVAPTPDELLVPTSLPVGPGGPPTDLPIPTRTPPEGQPGDLPIPTRTPPDGPPGDLPVPDIADPPGGPGGAPQSQPPAQPPPASQPGQHSKPPVP